ncbi:MAG: ABC transporter ATP-binding protein [Candidatus Omnitrophica bacterium]|nr:ABC transporter ATP-binding protein [Candidatus Omnitrophota bacterium]
MTTKDKTVKYKALRNLTHLLRLKPKDLLFLTSIITIASVLEAAGIGLLYPVINMIEDRTKGTFYAGRMNGIFGTHITVESFFMFVFLGMFLVFLVRGLFIILSFYSQYRLSEKLRTMLQVEIFKNYLGQEYDFFIRNRTGDLIQKQMTHTEMAGDAIVYTCQISRHLFTAVCLYVTLFIVSWKATLYLTGFMVIMSILSLIVARAKVYVSSEEHARLQKRAYSIVAEVITGIRQVKAFLAERFFEEQFADAATKRARIYMRNATLGNLVAPVMQTAVLIGILAGLFLAARSGSGPEKLMPLIAVFGSGAYRIMTSMAGVNSNFLQIAHLLPSVNIVTDLLRMKTADTSGEKVASFNEDISFRDVEFAYSRDGFKLSCVNMRIEKGRFYGIVGGSGSGKSTLVDLIIGFYPNTGGQILVDGRDMRGIDRGSWRKHIGLISQDTFIFSGTIEENISFAVEEGSVDAAKVEAAARAADIHDFIMSLPDGYGTIVGERGLNLSGGQRQRLAIARAVYRDPDIYIFDEATSSLDTYSEKKIQGAIEALSRSKTVIAIAHRLSTVMNADEIIVVREGVIVEKGSHDGLIKKNGVYAGMCVHQMGTNGDAGNDG